MLGQYHHAPGTIPNKLKKSKFMHVCLDLNKGQILNVGRIAKCMLYAMSARKKRKCSPYKGGFKPTTLDHHDASMAKRFF